VGLGIGALALVRPSPVALAVVMAIALAIDQVLRSLPRLGLDTRNQTAVSALLMLVVTSQTSTIYAGTHAWERAVGAAVALAAESLDDRMERYRRHRAAARRD
jgi:hypothetical protein